MNYQFKGELQNLMEKAQQGGATDVGYIMQSLTDRVNLTTTRDIDFAPKLANTWLGMEPIKHTFSKVL